MSVAGAKILSRIAVVAAAVAGLSGQAVAQTAPACNTGSLANGGYAPFTFNLDATQSANFTVDSTANDLAMLVIDDQKNVACQTAIGNATHLSCSWVPTSGVSYTVQVMRPATPDAIAAAGAAAAAAASNGGSAATDLQSGSVAPGPMTGLGGPTEDFNLCQQTEE